MRNVGTVSQESDITRVHCHVHSCLGLGLQPPGTVILAHPNSLFTPPRLYALFVVLCRCTWSSIHGPVPSYHHHNLDSGESFSILLCSFALRRSATSLASIFGNINASTHASTSTSGVCSFPSSATSFSEPRFFSCGNNHRTTAQCNLGRNLILALHLSLACGGAYSIGHNSASLG